MNEAYIPGLKFVVKNKLTVREVEVYMKYLEAPKTSTQVAKELNASMTAVYNITSRLKLKGLLTLKEKSESQENVYEVTLS